MIETLVNRVIELAEIKPEKLAVGFKQERVTYGELYRRASNISRQLEQMGIAGGG